MAFKKKITSPFKLSHQHLIRGEKKTKHFNFEEIQKQKIELKTKININLDLGTY